MPRKTKLISKEMDSRQPAAHSHPTTTTPQQKAQSKGPGSISAWICSVFEAKNIYYMK
jgi:hypothetical protein